MFFLSENLIAKEKTKTLAFPDNGIGMAPSSFIRQLNGKNTILDSGIKDLEPLQHKLPITVDIP